MVKVSVIIPVYNTEKYLQKCLDSILAQTLRDIEIICVDDGSTDSCLDILKSYAEKDRRIRIIHKENGGLVSARKAGVRAARGKYTGYVDSDDWVEPGMYENLYRHGERNQADLVCSGYFLEGNYTTSHYDCVPEGLYHASGMDSLREKAIFNTGERDVGIRASLCCKLFLTERIKRVQGQIPDGLTISEDKMCVLTYLLDCSRVYIAREAYYHYVIHPESMVHAPNPCYLETVNVVYQYMISLYGRSGFTKAMRVQAELYITEMLYKGINSRLGFENRNLLWIDPYWLSEIPLGSSVVLYGAGELGEAYQRQLASREDIIFTAYVDEAWERLAEGTMQVLPVDMLLKLEYDLVVITVKNPQKAQEVKTNLIFLGVPEEKVRWFEQKEIFWKYAEANGWI